MVSGFLNPTLDCFLTSPKSFLNNDNNYIKVLLKELKIMCVNITQVNTHKRFPFFHMENLTESCMLKSITKHYRFGKSSCENSGAT